MTLLDRYMQVAEDAIRFPHSALQIAQLADLPETANSELVAHVEEDPAFSARLLRLVNISAFPGWGNAQIANLESALVRVGRQKVAELALLQASASAFSGIESTLLRATTFWNHSQQTAVVARRIASVVGISESSCYVAGLLHDIGLLLMFHTEPKKMEAVLEFSLDESVSLLEAEVELLGVSHPDLGGHLAATWNLPTSLSRPIKHHHAPWQLTLEEDPQDECAITTCVALANEICGDLESADEPHESKVLHFAQQHLSIGDVNLLDITLAGCTEAEAMQPLG